MRITKMTHLFEKAQKIPIWSQPIRVVCKIRRCNSDRPIHSSLPVPQLFKRILHLRASLGFRSRRVEVSSKSLSSSAEMVKERSNDRVRLYVHGRILGYKRSKSNQYENTSLVQIEGVNTKEEVDWYLGKRLAYIYKAKTKKSGTNFRCIWGKVTRPHGNSGVVRSKDQGFHVSQQHLRILLFPEFNLASDYEFEMLCKCKLWFKSQAADPTEKAIFM
ncbi:hypothetical protein ZIOFF_009324 [Zingiber officinale]|uniref:Ribosomal protein L35A n=1 Tax=Zingiber officinale TaxID=94328 RepID=A0A8J5HFF6_ZINOF|nr:hypothetical protein ZIOFF_009324 [Zingiber officinale]